MRDVPLDKAYHLVLTDSSHCIRDNLPGAGVVWSDVVVDSLDDLPQPSCRVPAEEQ